LELQSLTTRREGIVGKRILLAIAAIIILFFAWHLYLTDEAKRVARDSSAKASESGGEVTLSLNPITNVVDLTLSLPPPEIDKKNPWVALGSQLGSALTGGLMKVIEPLAERELNTKAREKFDLYAILVPYRLRITFKDPDSAMLERIRARREELRKAEDERKLEKVRSYLREGLTLEDVQVAPGERFGRTETGVFGTIVNQGQKTLRKVQVRVYFLDAAGRRIGEKDYIPVLVSQFSFGNNTPLRPGYRKDFGYSVHEDAPTGWAKRVEAEIVDIEFAEETS